MTSERIVSFLPSATEVLYQLGAGDQLVGVTHECKFPEAAKRKPRVINPSFNPAKMNSKELDDKIAELMQYGRDIYVINDKILKEAKPDLIVAQGVCEVCSPFTKEIKKAISILDYEPDILILDTHDLDDILISIMNVAERVGRIKEGRKLIDSLQNRIEIIKFDPDKIILMPCGFDIDRTLIEFEQVKTSDEWKSLLSDQNIEIFAVDAGQYFSKPSPRTVTGLEILAKIIHQDKFMDQLVPKDSFIKIQ